MIAPPHLPSPGVTARSAVQTAPLRPGQMLEAVVAGRTADGATTLRIGDLVITARLPEQWPPGTTLQLQVRTAGPAPQLVLAAPPTLPSAPVSPPPLAPATVPMPTNIVVSGTQAPPPTPLPVVQQAVAPVAGSTPARPSAPAVTAPQAPVPVAPGMVPATPPAPGSLPAAPSVIAESGQSPAPASATNATGALPGQGASPISTPAPIPAQSRGQPPAPPVAPPAVPPASAGPPAASTSASGMPVPGAPIITAPLPSQATTLTIAPATTSASATPPPVPPAAAPAASAAPVVPAAPTGTAAPVPASAVPALLPGTGNATAIPASVAAPLPEAPAGTPLILAQSAPRPAPVSPAISRPSAAPAPIAPAAAPQLQTPAAALARMIPEALARQDSPIALLTTLATLAARPGALPEPVLRAALQVLGQRVQLPPGGGPSANQLEAAIQRSGIFLEAGLARGAPAADMKSALVALRGTLGTWFGATPPPVEAVRAAPPPLRGLSPRAAAPSEDLPLPPIGRETARMLHQQSDAALSRIKLMQAASLPDADPVRPAAPELRMEVPFLVGGQLALAQFQITRDAARRRADGKRGWTMRFAMHLSGTGEVGAEIGLIGRSVSVALWAAERETAERLEAALPDLAPALAALGLEAGAVRVRRGAPEPELPSAGRYLDSLT